MNTEKLIGGRGTIAMVAHVCDANLIGVKWHSYSMRLLLFLCVLVSVNAVAQWQPINSSSTDTGNIYHLNGNVGIGSSAPAFHLDVAGTIRSNGYFKITNVSTSNNGIFADDSWGSTVFSISRNANNETRFQSYGFHTFFSGGNTGVERMRIDENGNVGIGINAPTNKLHLLGDLRMSGAARKIIVGTESSISDYLLLQDVGTGAAFQWVQDGAPKFSIEGVTGNVGVGISTPTSKLHIADGAGGDQLQLSRGSGAVRFGQDNNQDNLYLWNKTGSMTYMYWQANGFVGIGTTSPDAKLAVKGTVHAQEVKVDLNGAVAPDYVFEADYKLLSLEEIKSYIAQHKHLPEIPSAKEIEANGINLGEMNLLLLKKVEELTLHMLHKEDEIKSLKSDVELL